MIPIRLYLINLTWLTSAHLNLSFIPKNQPSFDFGTDFALQELPDQDCYNVSDIAKRNFSNDIHNFYENTINPSINGSNTGFAS